MTATLLALLVTGVVGAAGSALGLSRTGRPARLGAALGVLALLVIAILALALDASHRPATSPLAGTGVLDDRLVPTGYLRLVVALWAMDALLISFVAWLRDGVEGLRGLLPAMLTAITGGAVAFGATDLVLGAAAAGVTGLATVIVVLVAARSGSVEAAAGELRVSLVGPALLIGVAATAPVVAAVVLRGLASGGGATASGAGPVAGLLSLAVVTALAVRFGALPFHVRVPHLADAIPPLALPLSLAWVPVPLGVVGLAIADRQLAPLALPIETEQWIVVGVALTTLVAAALAAFAQDDLRHATGYLVIADGALVLLGMATLDPAAWGAARTWLVVLAGSKTALLAWSAVMEERFETRSIPDLRGWLRRAPILGSALVVVTVATFGLPGWVALSARSDLTRLAAGPPWDSLLVLASFATLPTYLRLLGVGAGPATSQVSRAAPERIVRGWRPAPEPLPVEQEGRDAPGSATEPERLTAYGVRSEPGGGSGSEADNAAGARAAGPRTTGARVAASRTAGARVAASRAAGARAGARAAAAGRAFAGALRRDQTELVAAAVLALAILAALTSWGALDISSAAAEPAPIVSGPASD